MKQEIVRDTFFLQRKSDEATKEDLGVAIDLMDTLRANQSRCVGMAANMIGKSKNIIAFFDGKTIVVMLNPVITKQKGSFSCEEGCLSLDGVRTVQRYREISVTYQDMEMKKHTRKYSGFSAQIIQHEVDHLNGVLI